MIFISIFISKNFSAHTFFSYSLPPQFHFFNSTLFLSPPPRSAPTPTPLTPSVFPCLLLVPWILYLWPSQVSNPHYTAPVYGQHPLLHVLSWGVSSVPSKADLHPTALFKLPSLRSWAKYSSQIQRPLLEQRNTHIMCLTFKFLLRTI